MKKLILPITLSLVIFFSGCSAKKNQDIKNIQMGKQQIENSIQSIKPKNPPNTVVPINEQATGEKGTFYLGMVRDDVLTALKSMNIDTSSEIEITSSKDSWDWGNKVIQTSRFSFAFDKKNILYNMTVLDDTPTTLGLKCGDSLTMMEKLYGVNYNDYKLDNSTIYSYKVGNNFFVVILENDKITKWEITKYDLNSQVQNGTTGKLGEEYRGEWYADDYNQELNNQENKVPVGTKTTINVSETGGVNIVIVSSSKPPASRVAGFNTKLIFRDATNASFDFDDDGWGNQGKGTVVFKDKKATVSINITKLAQGSNWSIFEGKKVFLKK